MEAQRVPGSPATAPGHGAASGSVPTDGSRAGPDGRPGTFGGARCPARSHRDGPAAYDERHSLRKRRSTLSTMRETLLSKPLWGRLPQKEMEPTENTAPPSGVSK